jgi:predicted TIM-barrel fold metal-dependent hydrolase
MMSDVPRIFPNCTGLSSRHLPNGCPGWSKKAVRRSGTKGFPKLPFKEFNIYVTTETNDDFDYVLRYAGEDNVVIGTDYGHTDASSEVDAIDIFRANDLVGDPIKKKILDDNPRRLYVL